MENKSIFTQNFLKITHLPTIILLVGYPVYWLELYLLNANKGRTSWLAWFIFLFIALAIIIKDRKSIYVFFKWFRMKWISQDSWARWFSNINLIIILAVLLITLYATLLPPHLSQEFDAINYHLTIPRQHLITGSFSHIRWSSADLFLLPIDFALAPYWFVGSLPNKFPQFLFLIGLVLVSVSLVRRLSRCDFASICLIVLAIFGSNFIAIQMGTAMLDIAVCYLFIAAIDSFLSGNIIMATVEFVFFAWSKPFIFPQVFIITALTLISWKLYVVLGPKYLKLGFEETGSAQNKSNYIGTLKKAILPFVIFSIIIGGPFLLKSTYYSGTPLFPFAPGIINVNNKIDKNSDYWKSMLTSSSEHISTKDGYGHGKSLGAFLKHFWLIAVPEKNVNNSYDYPVGLMYLLFIGPFLYMLFSSFKKKEFSILSVFIIFYWLSWWFGSQQTRFLYIPFILMMIIVSSAKIKQSKIFIFAVTISVLLTGLSVFGANKGDFFKSREDILRAKDREILQLNKQYSEENRTGAVSLNYFDVAYANFPVTVMDNNSRWVLRPGK